MNSTTTVSPDEQMALAAAIAAVDGTSAAKRGVLKGLQGAAMLLEQQEISTSDALSALASGSTRTGDQILFRTLSVLTKYLTPWGVLLLLGLGLYQAVQTASASATAFLSLVKRSLAFIAPLNVIKEAVGRIFKDEKLEEDPATGLSGIATLVATEVPLFGIMVRGLEQVTPIKSDVYQTQRSIEPQLGAGGYDIAYDGDSFVDIAYDRSGHELDMDSLEEGDIVYDNDGGKYKVDTDGDLVPV